MTTLTERHAAVARRIVRECAAVRAGDNVYIEGRGDSLEYLELLAFECELVGALPLVVAQSDEARRRRLVELEAGQLGTKSRSWIEAVKAADVVLTMHLEDGDPRLFADVATSQRSAEGRGRKLLADHIYDGTRRWIGSDFPTAAQAAVFGMDFDAYSESFWRSLDLDYGVLRERGARVAGLLRGASEVRITSPKGTDVSMAVEGRPLDLDVGVVTAEAPLTNLPAGEVCLAPIETSANGVVVFDVAFLDGRWVEDLEVEFTGGVACGVRAVRGLDLFNDTIAGASGAGNIIGELGIGLNHEVTAPCGNMLLDEKILGTIHIAVGENTMLGGANDSSLHWDLLVMNPTVTVDGRTLLAGGELAV
jgi:leucyl aminopeptidase (aminopeptidase T)